MRGLIKSIAVGTFVGGGPALIITVPLAVSSALEHASLAVAIYLATLPLLVALVFIVPTVVIVGFPVSILLRKLKVDSLETYVACGVAVGLLAPIGFLALIGAADGYWLSFFGALAGAATAHTWWRSQECSQSPQARSVRSADRIKLVAAGVFSVALICIVFAVNSPSRVSIDGTRYSVPKKVQFMKSLGAQNEVYLKFSGEELAKNVNGYQPTFRTVPGTPAPADIQVEFKSGGEFSELKAHLAHQMDRAPTIPARRLPGQDALVVGCIPFGSMDGSTSRLCNFVYWDKGKTLFFSLGEENLAFAPEVARYAAARLEQYRAR